MKKLTLITLIAGLFTMTGCKKEEVEVIICQNCSCAMTMTMTTTVVTTDGVGGSDSVTSTATSSGSSAVDNVCEGDVVNLNETHAIEAGNISGTHSYTDVNVNVVDNQWNNGTTTTTTETTTTYDCTCVNV